MTRFLKDFITSGKKLSLAFGETLKEIKPGRSLAEIEKIGERAIVSLGGKPSFKMVSGYHWATCINLNEGVVHGIPDKKKVKKGDLVSLDMGMYYRGWHTDMAYTFVAGKPFALVWQDRFLGPGRRALEKAIEAAREGKRVVDISRAIEKEIKKAGFSPVKSLTGHGVGERLHQRPFIPCFVSGGEEEEVFLERGKGLAIEVIYTEEESELFTETDGWTIKARNGKMAGLFEKTVLINGSRPKVLTPFWWEKNAQEAVR